MDTIFYHGRIHTMAGRTVTALAVQGDRIAFAGSDEEALALAGPETKRVDLQGRCVLPGFVDTHTHILLTGVGLHRLDLRSARSQEDLIRLGREYLAQSKLPPGEWVVGFGFDHNLFDPPCLPDGKIAEAISAEHPVLLDRICGHVGAANPLALKLAGLDETTVLSGGELHKGPDGKLNGIVNETALETVKKAIPRLTQERVEALILEIGGLLAATGLVGVHSDDLGPEGCLWPVLKGAFDALEAQGTCPIRLWEEWEAPNPEALARNVLSQPLRSFQGTPWLKLGNIKLLSDGSLGARTALLRGDYHDAPGNQGIATYEQEKLDAIVWACHQNDLQVACHAIGDGACAMFVEAVEKAMAKDPKPLLHRVVHCQFGDEALYRKMASLGMGADIQPAFLPSDAPLLPTRIGAGARAEESYAWKTLLDLGVTLGGGSDSPVEPFAPLWGIHCAVNRPGSHTDAAPFLPQQALTVEEAVGLYTTGPAKLAHVEQDMGTLEAGKLADLVVLERDLFTVPAPEIKDIPVVLTMAGGRVTHGNLDAL